MFPRPEKPLPLAWEAHRKIFTCENRKKFGKLFGLVNETGAARKAIQMAQSARPAYLFRLPVCGDAHLSRTCCRRPTLHAWQTLQAFSWMRLQFETCRYLAAQR